MAAANSQALPENLFDNLKSLYMRALSIDETDVEANFNLGLLYLQFNQELSWALGCFQKCVAMDKPGSETATLFKAQFAKSHYNIGMIYDKMGHVQAACDSYKSSMDVCESDLAQQLTKSATYKKAGTNYAVTLEKLGKRDGALHTLDKLKDSFGSEVRVFNNLGIIQKRMGNNDQAMINYETALKAEPQSFFPNYNMGVLLSQDKNSVDESLAYFNRALEQAHRAQEFLYEINVLVNISLLHEASKNYQAAIETLERALLIDGKNEKILSKIKQLNEMLSNRLQGNQLSPMAHNDGKTNALPAADSQRDPLTESQELRKNE